MQQGKQASKLAGWRYVGIELRDMSTNRLRQECTTMTMTMVE